MDNYKVKVSYDGTNFSGWAKQNNVRTVQDEIENTLSKIFETKIKIFGSGRTDKYVHAMDQCFNFKAKTNIPFNFLKSVINSKLPNDININSVKIVDNSFHARFSITSKTYLYKINIDKFNLFEQNYAYQYCKNIDLAKLKKISPIFIGKKDFLSFSTSDVDNSIREIKKIVINKDDKYVYIKITGNGFLRNMVRMIVACFLNYNENKISIEDINSLFEKPKKGKSISKAPGCGLYLYKTNY